MITDKNIKKFEKAAKALNKAIESCKKDLPGCFAYLDANNNFCLLDGSSGIGEDGAQDSIVSIVEVNAQCGDW